MPKITGLSEENAKVVLEAVGLELGERKEAKSSEVAKGKIISQDVHGENRYTGGKCHWLYSQSGKRNPLCGGDQR
ncbi:MAG: PASTA domain-containing protein [Clostridium fessum]